MLKFTANKPWDKFLFHAKVKIAYSAFFSQCLMAIFFQISLLSTLVFLLFLPLIMQHRHFGTKVCVTCFSFRHKHDTQPVVTINRFQFSIFFYRLLLVFTCSVSIMCLYDCINPSRLHVTLKTLRSNKTFN